MKDQNKKEKQRKGLLFLPLVVIPFLTLIFWTLGGGQAIEDVQNKETKNVLQTNLPDAKNDSKKMDKLSYYNAAKQDSIARESQIKSDPYYQNANGGTMAFGTGGVQVPPPNTGVYAQQNYGSPGFNQGGYGTPSIGYPNPEAKVYDKLNSLNAALNQQSDPRLTAVSNTGLYPTGPGVNSEDIDRLENMMRSMQNGNPEGDPEMAQINGMLEKILDIQNPGRVKEKMNKAADQKRGQVYLVSTPKDQNPVTMITKPSRQQLKETTGFYSLDDMPDIALSNSISAVVHENQTVTSGSIIKLRLLNDISINGITIPKDNFIFGEANLSGERLNIEINSIRYRNNQFAVQLNVFDLDGMSGVYVPGAISRDVAKESGTNALSGVGLNGFDNGIGMQAASAGIEFSKNLIGKKVKLVKVYLKSGYKVLLKDEQDK